MAISRPRQTVEFRSIITGLILASFTGYLLVMVGKHETTSGTDRVLLIISGMTTIAALSAFDRFIERNQKTTSSVDEILFDEVLISKSVIEIEASESRIAAQKDKVAVTQSLPWDLSLDRLVGIDNSLALAQLRIEIERELRRIAYEHRIDISTRPIGIVGLAQELVYREHIPAVWLGVLKEINTVCSRVIHGLEISNEQASSVVRVGGQMLEQLRLVVLK